MKYSEAAQLYASSYEPVKQKLLWPFPSPVDFDAHSQIVKDSGKMFDESIFASPRVPIDMGHVILRELPASDVYVLRMPIRHRYAWAIPQNLGWLTDFFVAANNYQLSAFGTHQYPYVYLTIRHGEQKEYGTDVWHTDGFQGGLKSRHIGEISYIWTSDGETEWSTQGLTVPADFNPALHNFFCLLKPEEITATVKSKPAHMYCFDAYSVHRKCAPPGNRTMIRLTFSNVEIKDPNYTVNPSFNLKYNKIEPRDQLVSYS